MTWDDSEVDALHRRLRVLAERPGLTLPAMDVVDDPKGRLSPAAVRDCGDGQDHIAVSSSLLRASPDAQTWHLATALGHWASPAPRRRRRQGWVTGGLLPRSGSAAGSPSWTNGWGIRGSHSRCTDQRIRAAVSSSRTCRSSAGRRGQEVHSGSGGSR